ncbi:reelin-like isoform X2 [Oscarella lobularis]|uniref:reelin-like isoform X2 n=1 Tax=Oscarella lobularis TaxID=121494 RepID=UPI00331360CD
MRQSLVLPSLATVCLLALIAGSIQADTDCTEYGVLLRDDFEASPARKSPDNRQWSETHGVVVNNTCSSRGVLAGKSAVFNGRYRRTLVTRDLASDVITAVRLDAISCFSFSGSVIAQLSYSTNGGIDYRQAKNFTVSSFGSSMVYELPSFPNDAYVRIRLREVSLFTGIADYHTWEVDNFVVYGKPPLSLATDFDTVAACNEGLTWIGSSVQPSDDGNALIFTSSTSPSSSKERVASTVPINLDSSVPLGSGKRQIIFAHDFSSSTTFGRSSSWKAISGGVITASRCAAYGTDDQAFFSGTSSRFIETNPLDLEHADKLDFWIVIGGSGCRYASYNGEDISVEYALENNPSSYIRMHLLEHNMYTKPQLVSVRLPFLARTSRTTIRWRQTYDNSEWSLNHVVISGVHPTEFSSFPAEFSSSTTFGSFSYWAAISGGQVSSRPDCFAYGSGYQAFFYQSGPRFIKTQPLDLRNIETVTFWIVIGGSGCEVAESVNKSVVVEYAYHSSNFRIIEFLKNDGYQNNQYAEVFLPLEARTASTTIRWRQLQHDGYWNDEWSINNIRFTGSVIPVIEQFSADFTSSTTFGSQSLWARISGGSVTDAAKCRAYGVNQAFFSQSEERFIQTQPLDLRSAAYLHFRIAFGGGCEPADSGESVVVEYSSSQNSTFIVMYTVEPHVTSVSVLLPLSARTASTAIRWRQMKHSGKNLDEWSLNHITFTRPSNFPSYFSSSTAFGESGLYWSAISGGNVSDSYHHPCRAYGYGYQAFFDQSSPRYIRTQALDLQSVRAISFWIVLGGSGCGTATTQESIVVEYWAPQYSTFRPLQYLSYNSYQSPQEVEVALPIAAQAASTTIQWRQLSNRGSGLAQWALNNIKFILDVNFPSNFTASLQNQSWASISGGFITSSSSCYAFGGPGSYQAFFSGWQDRYIATQPLDLRKAEELVFWIVLGIDGCNSASFDESVVVEYASLPLNFKTMLTVYRRWPSRLQIPLPLDAQTPSTVIRWRQLAFSSGGDAEWAINGVYFVAEVIGRFSESFPSDFSASTTFGDFSNWAELSGGTITEHSHCHSYGTYQAFFSSNRYRERYIRTQPLDLRKMKELTFWFVLGSGGSCNSAERGESVVVEFATSAQNHSFTTMNQLGYNAYKVSKLVKVALPAEAKTASTAIQWRQLSHSGSNDKWSINHVAFIPEVLLGKNFPSDFSEAITFGQLSEWGSISGGSITSTAKCNAYGVYQAFFNQSGVRSIQTQPLDLTETELLIFWIIIGGGQCDPAEGGESVVVEYTHSNRANFALLLTLVYNAYRSSRPVTIKLPSDARKRATVIRWRQLKHSNRGLDEWALNHVAFSSGGREKFLQFDLIMEKSAQDVSSYDINLEYSVDLGQKWQPVVTACNPTTSLQCKTMMPFSVYKSVLFHSWARIQIKLDDAVISSRTQFRYKQPSFSSTANWAIDNVYIGNSCPGDCSGHGKCIITAVGKAQSVVCGGNDDGRACTFPFFFNGIQYYSCIVRGREHPWCATTSNYDTDRRWGYCECGTCQCDSGHSGVLCNVSLHENPTYLRETFETGFSSSKWSWIGGGLIGTLCGVISAGNAAVFYTGRSRLLQTVDLDLTAFSPELEFSFKYSSDRRCSVSLARTTNYVALQFSTDGGRTWSRLGILSENKPRAIYSLSGAQTNSTRLRWFQAYARGFDLDVWAVDDVYINSVYDRRRQPFFDSFDPMNNAFWTFHPGSSMQPHCSSLFSSLYFSNFFSTTRRYLSTSRFRFSASTTVQFEIVVDCGGQNMSSSTSVELQYSRGNDVWTLLDSGCQPARGCSRGGYRSSSIYRSGSMSNWTRVTIPFSQTQLPYSYFYQNIQLRWLASSGGVAFGWAIGNVYIGNSCPNFCSGHGRCTTNVQCLCDSGYSGYQCSQSATYKPFEIKERFDGKYSRLDAFSVIESAKVSNECGYLSSGNSLVFGEEGERGHEIERQPLQLHSIYPQVLWKRVLTPNGRSVFYKWWSNLEKFGKCRGPF